MLPTEGDDNLFLTDDADRVNARGGNDRVNGRAGDDYLDGGFGNDTLLGGLGNDSLDSNPNTFGEPGGGYGDDKLYGEDGNDLLFSGYGFNQLYGGSGNDTLASVGSGWDVFDGGASIDTDIIRIDYVPNTLQYLLSIRSITNIDVIAAQNGVAGRPIRIDVENDADLSQISILVDFDEIRGSPSANLIQASGVPNLDNPNYNNDTIYGYAGDDTLGGGAGDDLLYGSTGNDVEFGAGGADFLVGELGFDRLNGGPGADVLVGGFDEDVLSGGGGADRFVFYDNWGNDRISDYADGADRFDLRGSGLTFANLTVIQSGADTLIDATRLAASIRLENVNATAITAADFDF